MAYSYIQQEIDACPVVLFIKGTAEHPMCGFSRVVVRILQGLKVPFKAIDIFDHPTLRDDLKIFSQWPTFPQLYVNGQFIGGCDIVRELYTCGDLQTLLAPYIPTSDAV
jgi:monothiol glutaredoxin